MVILQDRDICYLELLSKYGILNKESVDNIYGSTKYACFRKKKLSDDGYIIKTNSISYLSAKGKQYIEKTGRKCKEIPYDKKAQQRLAKISSIMIPIEKYYNCYPSWTVKDENNDKMLFYGKIQNKRNGKEYYIYNLGKFQLKEGLTEKQREKAESFKEHHMSKIKKEIGTIREKKLLERVILFYDDVATKQLYMRRLESLDLKEQLLIPCSERGLELLNAYGREEIDRKIVEKMYGNHLSSPHWSCSDFTFEPTQTQVVVLATFDCTKISILQAFREARISNSSQDNVEIICFEWQKEYLPQSLRSLPIKIINEDELMKMDKEEGKEMNFINKDHEEIINLINKFGCIGKDEIKKILKLKVIEKTDNITGEKQTIDKGEILLDQIVKSKMINVTCDENDIFYVQKQYVNPTMVKALKVPAFLIEHGDTLNWCETSDYPFTLTFFRNGNVYDIAVIEENEESAMKALIEKNQAERIILIVNSLAQVPKLKLENKMYQFCMLEPEVKFFES